MRPGQRGRPDVVDLGKAEILRYDMRDLGPRVVQSVLSAVRHHEPLDLVGRRIREAVDVHCDAAEHV